MKKLSNNATRIITSIVGIILILPCFIFMHAADGLPLAILVALISTIAVYEVINAVGCKNKVILALSMITAAAIPFVLNYKIGIPFMPVAIIYSVVYFILMVTMHKKTVFSDVVTALFATVAIPSSLSCLLLLRDLYIQFPGSYEKVGGVFFIVLAIFCAWLTDIFAYAVGRRFGKHKLCPEISPKKSVEGAIGGVVGTAVCNGIMWFLFDKYLFVVNVPITFGKTLLFSVVLSIISMFGDLTASIIKRNHGIKDFGNILPGHGGVMDRFDSTLFVLPVLYAMIYFKTII